METRRLLWLALTMKRKLAFYTSIFSILILALAGCKNESSGFCIDGKINDQNGNFVYLEYDDKIDSTEILNDSFQFKGKVNIPTEAFLRINKEISSPWLLGDSFMLENNDISINLEYSKTSKENVISENLILESIVGSKIQLIVEQFRKELNTRFYEEKNDSLKKEALFGILKDFIEKNPKLGKSGEILATSASYNKDYLDLKKTEFLYSLLDTVCQKKEVLDEIKLIVKQRKFLTIGSIIPKFKLYDLEGEVFDTENNLSEYILIDFWASWCLPCRYQNPELVKLYKLYKDKGLEIVSISIDKDTKAWKQAVKKDSMNWVNLSDSNHVVADNFYLSRIPMTILIDKTGRIIDKNLEIFSYDDQMTSFADILNLRMKK